MAQDPRVPQLLDELLDSGATPEELCRDCPELLPDVREAWQRLAAVQAQIGRLFPPTGSIPTTEQVTSVHITEELPRIPGYELEGELGHGGVGVVYKARHLRLNRTVALKMLLAGPFARPEERDRFRREAEAVAAVRHPNIVQVHDCGEFDGRPFFTMEYAEGGPLSRKLAGKPLPAREAACLLATLTDAVRAAHAAGIVHRDLKPSNILLVRGGVVSGEWSVDSSPLTSSPLTTQHSPLTPKISDFGLARRMEGEAGLTRTGAALGTPSYMAPEQARGDRKAIGPVTDVYALGAILYECLTGRPPFQAETASATLQQVQADDPVPPKRLNPQVPRDLETISLKCLEKDPHRRYPTAQALADDLRRFECGESIAARPAGRLERVAKWTRRRPAAAALLLVSGVAALALVGVVVSLVYSARLEVAKNKAEGAQQRLEALQYRHQIHRAHAGLRDGNIGQVEAFLEACPVEQRHWEWQYLERQCRAELLTFKSTSVVSAVDFNGNVVSAFSPDGKRCAFAGKNGTVKICDATTGQEMRTLTSPNARPGGIALSVVKITYSEDGARLALACSDNTIRIWNATNGQELQVLEGHTHEAYRLIFSRDGRRLASVNWWEQAVRLWDLTTGRQILPPLKAPTESAMFHPGAVVGIAFSPDGACLAAGNREGTICIWDVSTGRRLRSFKGDTFEIWDLAFSPDGTRLASGGHDHTVKIWDLDPGHADGAHLLLTLRGHTTWLSSVAFSPDGARIASASVDGVIKIWAASTGEELASFAAHDGMVRTLGFSPNGTRLFSNGRGGPKVWDATTDPKARTFARPQGQSGGGKLSPDGKRFAFANFDSPDRTATVLDATTGQTVHTLKGHTDRVWDVVFSHDSTRIATASSDGTVKIWNAESGREMLTLKGHTGAIQAVAFSPDGKRLTSASQDKTARVWDLTTGREVLRLEGHTKGNPSVSYSPDGKRIATGAFDTVAKTWDADSGHELHALTGHTWWIEQLAFSPNGRWLASASSDRTVKIWGRDDRHFAPHPQGPQLYGLQRGVYPGWQTPGLGKPGRYREDLGPGDRGGSAVDPPIPDGRSPVRDVQPGRGATLPGDGRSGYQGL